MKLLILLFLLSLIHCDYTWLPTVTGYNEYDADNGYAGILGRSIVAITIDGGVQFRIHYLGKGARDWEPITTGTAGNYKTKIDGIAIKGKLYKVYSNGYWLPAVTGFDIYDDMYGYAGNLNNEISGLMIKGCKYAVAILQGQIFVSYGTGVQDITPQYLVPNMKEGCYFMGCCVIGGLGNDEQIQDAYRWSLSLGYINDLAWVTSIDGLILAKRISDHYGTTFHKGWTLQYGCNHYWVLDLNGNEVFNAAGLGFIGNC